MQMVKFDYIYAFDWEWEHRNSAHAKLDVYMEGYSVDLTMNESGIVELTYQVAFKGVFKYKEGIVHLYSR